MPARERRRAHPARIGPRLPRVALMPALVVPRGEIGVIVFAADLEQMRMIRDQLGYDAGRAKIRGQRPLPDFDRAPRLPQKIDRAAQDVVTRRDAWQRARVVTVEANRAARESVEIGRRELAPAVGAEHVTIEAVEQYYDGVLRTPRHDFARTHRSNPSRGDRRSGKRSRLSSFHGSQVSRDPRRRRYVYRCGPCGSRLACVATD